MARKAEASDHSLIALFLDMIAAERGGARNTLAAYSRDLADLSQHLGATGRSIAKASTDDLRGYLGSLAARGFAAVLGRTAALGHPPALSLSLRGGKAHRRSLRHHRRPERGRALPKVLSIADVDRLLTESRNAMAKAAAPAGTAARGPARLPDRGALRHGLRVSELVELPRSAAERNARMLTVRGKGGKERLVPLNDAAKAAMRDYLASLGRSRQSQKRQAVEMAVSFLWRERPPQPPAFRPRTEGARRRRRDFGPIRSAHMCCATPSPVTSCTTAPICASCRRCSAMPTYRRRRSIPMSWKSASRAWFATCTRWEINSLPRPSQFVPQLRATTLTL